MEAEPKLLVQVRNKLRARHYSYRTEQQYLAWVRRFILHYGKRHPRDVSAAEVEAFLTYLAVEREVSASTQNQGAVGYPFSLSPRVGHGAALARQHRPCKEAGTAADGIVPAGS